ncbi:BrnT family toxin [Novosphingobium lentum]|uniref:BrnT family toxin n=1 Tax=Novosphingobium lentum TaxID=145287 RepID=UPI00082F23D6|nr:BrnT family toxin [Novosphingobium lentum]
MEFTFDPAKDEANRFKHGVRLAFGIRIFRDPDHIISSSFRPVDGEDRNKAVGKVDGKLYTVIHVWRGEVIRLISVRRSNAREQRDYHSNPG